MKNFEKCPGCGSEIQFVRPGKPGFIPLDVYEKRLKEGKEILCQRCFKLKHYGMLTGEIDEEEISKFLKNFIDRFDNILYVIDILDFEGTYRAEIDEIIGRKNVIYVINKFDILPRSISGVQLKKWLLERIPNATKENVFMTSTKNGFGISKLQEYLTKLKGDMLVIGVTNVGKSSLLRMITNSKAIVSPYPGTTIGVIRHRLGNLRIYDTPGIMVNDRVIDLFDPKCQATVLSKGEISRKTFKPYPNEVIFISGLCKLRAELKGDHNLRPIFQIYAPEKVTFHKTKSTEFITNFSKYFGKELYPPCGKFDVSKLSFKIVDFEIDEEHELSIPGLCWINVKRGPVKFKIEIPQNVTVQSRPSLIKPKRKVKKH
ncbi:MAG: 50S ribosome-binding GTPase [Fervidobacterium sp.]|nr:50S ribosome-binding GTPase [Fervidobacterium sp.]